MVIVELLIKLVKCSLMTLDEHSNSYISTPFLGDVLHKPMSYYCVSTPVSTAYQYTKGPSRVRRTYVSIRSSYSTISSSYSSYAEVLRFFEAADVRGKSDTPYIRHTYVVHTKATWQIYTP